MTNPFVAIFQTLYERTGALYFFSKLWYKFEDRNLPLHQKCEKRRGVGGEERRGREATQEGCTAAAPLVRPQMDYS